MSDRHADMQSPGEALVGHICPIGATTPIPRSLERDRLGSAGEEKRTVCKMQAGCLHF